MTAGKADKVVEELTLAEAIELLEQHRDSLAGVQRKIIAIYDSKKPDLISTVIMSEEEPG